MHIRGTTFWLCEWEIHRQIIFSIFKTTLVTMGYPEYFHFLFSPEDLASGREPCNIDDGGANSAGRYHFAMNADHR